MSENDINNQFNSKICPFCGDSVSSNACANCNIFIDDVDDIDPELKKENKNEDEDEEYDWREHKR